MLCRCQVILSNLDVHSHFGKKDSAHPHDNNDGEYEMGPVSICVGRANVSPGKNIETCNVGRCAVISFACVRLVVELKGVCITSATEYVDRKQDGKGEESERDEDNEEGLQVSEEEVGIETAFVDDFSIFEFEDGKEPAEQAFGGRRGSFSFGN